MMFQGRSVISAVWGVVGNPAAREPLSLPSWTRLRLFQRNSGQRSSQVPRLPVSVPDTKADTRNR